MSDSKRSKRNASTEKPSRKKVDNEQDDNSSGIQALIVGLKVLQVVGEADRPLPLRDVASAAGLTNSRVHRYLASLIRTGFVRQEHDSGYYTLAQSSVELGLMALGKLDYIEIASKGLREFTEVSGLDAHLAIWSSRGPVIVRWQSGRSGFQMKVEEGRLLPILWSATGRVLMAYRPVSELLPIVQDDILWWNERNPGNPFVDSQIDDICQDVRRLGMSSSSSKKETDSLITPSPLGANFDRPYRLEFDTVSFPIFNHRGEALLAITCFGADQIPLHTPDSDHISLLRDAAAKVSLQLGFKHD